MSNSLVTIIMPVFNAQDFVVHSVASVLSQTHRNFEFFVIDDCSTDSSVAEIETAVNGDKRVKYFSTSSNSGGPAMPRNIGLEHFNGDYIAFIDSDDVWHEEKIALQLEWMENHDFDFSSTYIKKLKNVDEIKSGAYEASREVLCFDFDRLLKKNLIATSTVVFKSYLVGEERFSTKAKHVAVEDYLFWLHLHRKQEFKSVRLNSVMAIYIERDDSLSRKKIQMAMKIWALLGEENLVEPKNAFFKVYYFLHYIFRSLFAPVYR